MENESTVNNIPIQELTTKYNTNNMFEAMELYTLDSGEYKSLEEEVKIKLKR